MVGAHFIQRDKFCETNFWVPQLIIPLDDCEIVNSGTQFCEKKKMRPNV